MGLVNSSGGILYMLLDVIKDWFIIAIVNEYKMVSVLTIKKISMCLIIPDHSCLLFK